jgi:hypothetical protein
MMPSSLRRLVSLTIRLSGLYLRHLSKKRIKCPNNRVVIAQYRTKDFSRKGVETEKAGITELAVKMLAWVDIPIQPAIA